MDVRMRGYRQSGCFGDDKNLLALMVIEPPPPFPRVQPSMQSPYQIICSQFPHFLHDIHWTSLVNGWKYVSTAKLRLASTHDNNFSSYEVINNTATSPSPSPEALMYKKNSSQLFQLKLFALLQIITWSKDLNIQSAITSTISDI